MVVSGWVSGWGVWRRGWNGRVGLIRGAIGVMGVKWVSSIVIRLGLLLLLCPIGCHAVQSWDSALLWELLFTAISLVTISYHLVVVNFPFNYPSTSLPVSPIPPQHLYFRFVPWPSTWTKWSRHAEYFPQTPPSPPQSFYADSPPPTSTDHTTSDNQGKATRFTRICWPFWWIFWFRIWVAAGILSMLKLSWVCEV